MAGPSTLRIAAIALALTLLLVVAWIFLAPQWTGCACPIPGPTLPVPPAIS